MNRIQTQVETEYRAAGEPIDPLTYAVGADSFEHDQDSIDDPETDDETRAAWAAHRVAVGLMGAEQQRRIHRARLIKGIALEVPDGWADLERALGAAVPDDPVELKFAYFEDIFTTVEDWLGILKAIAGASLEGAGEEALSAVEAMFQRAMGRISGSLVERAGGEDEDSDGDVVALAAVPDRSDDEGVGNQE